MWTDNVTGILWVACQLDALPKYRSSAALEKALKSLPTVGMGHFLCTNIITGKGGGSASDEPEVEDEPLGDPRRRARNPRDIHITCSSPMTIADSDGRKHA